MDITKDKQADEALKVKKEFIERETRVIERIEEWIIPSLEAQLNFVLMNKMADPKSDLVVQFLGTIEFLKQIILHKKENIKVAQQASKKVMIELGRYVPVEEKIKDINITEAILKSVNATGSVGKSRYAILQQMINAGNLTDKDLEFKSKQLVIDQTYGAGVFLFDLATYELEGSVDGWGILLAASIGIASIATGLWILGAYGATSVFAATVGTPLVMQGVGDLVQSLVAFVKDQPIDIESYLKSKGMATAITLATAGLLHGANMIPYIQNLSFMQKMVAGILSGAADGTKMVLTALAVQGATEG